jgi:hypothetical protein
MASQKKTVIAAVFIASILMVAGVLALLTQTKTIPSSGTINPFKVGVYNNAGCTDVLFKINWTNVNPGGSTYEIVYVRNEATTVNMNLTMTTTGWVASPVNSTYVAALTWNSTGVVLTPGTIAVANVTLSTFDNAETETGLSITAMNVNIVGTQV